MFSKVNNAIIEYIKHTVEQNFDERKCDRLTNDYLDEYIELIFNNWHYNFNFYDWTDSDVSGIFENPHVLLEMIMINSNYFKEGFDMDWVSTQEKLTPEIVVNTYAYVYVKSELDAHEIIRRKSVELDMIEINNKYPNDDDEEDEEY